MNPIEAILAYVGQVIAGLVSQVQQGLSSAVGTIGSYLGDIARRVGETLASLIANIGPTIRDIVSGVTQQIQGIFGPLFESVTGVVAAIRESIAQFLAPIRDFLGELWSELKTSFGAILATVEEILSTVWDRLMAVTTEVLEGIAAFVRNLWGEIQAAIKSVVASVLGWIDKAWSTIVGWIKQGLALIEQAWDAVKGAVISGLNALLRTAQDVLLRTTGLIDQGWKHLVTGAESVIDSVNERLVGLKDAFGDAAAELVGSLAQLSDEQFSPIRESIKTLFGAMATDKYGPESPQFLSELRAITSGERTVEKAREFLSGGWSKAVPNTPFWLNVVGALIAVLMNVMAIFPLAGVLGQLGLQQIAKDFPYQLLAPAEVVAALRHSDLDRGQAMDILGKQGYSQADSNVLVSLSHEVPAESELIALRNRGAISDASFEAALKTRGYTEEWVAGFKELSNIIPGPQDLITMAVREAFSPEVAERFGQYEDFPPAFAAFAAKQGLSEEWAKRYWAAHWSLPSPSQGFEMLHRGVVSADDLDLLLRALDVMPFWRDRLKEIAFHNLTRVDVRRMHALKILDRQAVTVAYKRLGYDETDAERLADFTEKLNSRKLSEDTDELGKLTRGAVLGFYEDGLLDKGRATQLLVDQGHSAEAASLYLQSVDLGEERKARKAEADHVVELAASGAISIEQANDRLTTLNLETREVQRAHDRLVKIAEHKVKIPSQEDADKMWSLGIISTEEFRGVLQRLGYAERWVVAYMKWAERKKADAAAKAANRGSATA